MGRFSQKKHEEANDALINAVDTDTKFESLKEILAMLTSEDATKSFAQLVATEITNALGDDGAITTAISGAITAACGEDGAVTTAISSAITAATGEDGAVTTAISSAITAAIGTDGAIETWADGRYEPKTI